MVFKFWWWSLAKIKSTTLKRLPAWTLTNKFAKFERATFKGSEVTLLQSYKFVCRRASWLLFQTIPCQVKKLKITRCEATRYISIKGFGENWNCLLWGSCRENVSVHMVKQGCPQDLPMLVSNFQYSDQISTKTTVVKCYYLNYVKCKTKQTLLVSGSPHQTPPTPPPIAGMQMGQVVCGRGRGGVLTARL